MQGKCCFVFTAPLIWQQFKVKLEKFLCQCKVCCNNWKLLGDHGAIKLLEDDKNENWPTNRPLPFLTLQEQTKCCCIFMSLCTNGHKLSRRQLKHHHKRLFERRVMSLKWPPPCPGRKGLINIQTMKNCQKNPNIEERQKTLRNQARDCFDCCESHVQIKCQPIDKHSNSDHKSSDVGWWIGWVW